MANPIAVVVAFEIHPADKDRFVELVRQNAAQSVAVEPGCFRFDVVLPEGDAVQLYEVYSDRAAFDAHLKSAHFVAFDAETKAMTVSKRVVVGGVVEASK